MEQGDTVAPSLYGEFTVAGSRKLLCAVCLTDRDLIVQRLNSAPVARHRLVFSLEDCVGCRAFRPGTGADPAAYLAAYFYPLRRRWMCSRVSRQRVEQCFRLCSLQDPDANLEEAKKWARAIRERSGCQPCVRDGVLMSQLPRPCRMMLLVNPQSGKGQALTLYNNHIQRMLNEAGVSHTLVITERQNHARELVREADLSQWDALVIMSGDGLLYEVINGLLERSDWEEAIGTPLGILPGGSGNALAASLHHYSGASPVFSKELLVSCGFLLCRGLVSRMDLVSVQLGSGTRLFSFLSLAWGIVADVDIESERYRHVGSARFTVGMLVRLASLRVYRGKLAYLPAERTRSGRACRERCAPPAQYSLHNSCQSNNSLRARRLEERPPSHHPTAGHADLPQLSEPLTPDWVVVPEKDFVLVLAMCHSHLAEDLLAAPSAAMDDGLIHLSYIRAGISRSALLKLFLAMEKGAYPDSSCPHLVHATVRAVRLEPLSPKGIITVDGEVVEYGPVQAQVHQGMARLLTGGGAR
ncbi:sphingosine kinase 1-like [Synchiropus splendidus]|uniref:sphingosine kinase 1-like n=1 Tax=Synchiropus splendidus TaxID=270530 RepID=UPI00237E03D3|nr:sphingosine kinase 1-like [Synchiropus splendidus]